MRQNLMDGGGGPNFRSRFGTALVMRMSARDELDYDVGFDAHTIVYCAGGLARTRERRMDSSPAPREPTRSGEINLFPAGTILQAKVRGAVEIVMASVDASTCEEFYDGRRLAASPVIARFDPLCSAVAGRLREELGVERPEPLMVDTALMMLALQLLQPKQAADAPRPARLSPALLARALDYIDANLGRPIALTDLSRAVGLPPPAFARAFKASTGRSPYNFLLNRRIEKACELLKSTDDAIVDVALAVGFNSQSHLTSHFAKVCGATPGQYRRRR